MATNEIKPFATGVGANVLTQAEYEALTTLLASGFAAGVVPSKQANKVMRQSAFVASMIAQFTADNSGQNVLDDGVIATLQSNFVAALKQAIAGATSVTLTNANVTLTAPQAANPVIILSGTLTANLNLVFPTTAKPWVVINNCTGAYTVTCKTAAGTGVASTIGTVSLIAGDGTNIISTITVIADASTSVKGKIQLATNAEAVTGTDAVKAITPASLTGAFTGQQSKAASGYQKLPGGLILQWGVFTTSAAGKTNLTFPIAFPTGVKSITGNLNISAVASGAFINFDLAAATTTTIPCWAENENATTSLAVSVMYQAIGY